MAGLFTLKMEKNQLNGKYSLLLLKMAVKYSVIKRDFPFFIYKEIKKHQVLKIIITGILFMYNKENINKERKYAR